MKKIKKIDKPLFIMMIIYIILGLVVILSASSVSAVLRYNVSSYYFFIKQLIFTSASFLIGIFFILNCSTNKYKYFAPIYLIVSMFLLGLVVVIGKVAGGAQSWLDVGVMSIQPTEFCKSAIIIFMGAFYEYSLRKSKNFSFQLIPVVLALIIFFLIAWQPDFGGAMIIAGIVFFTFLKIPFEQKSKLNIIKYTGFGAILAVILLLYSGSEIFYSTQLSRLKFQNPCARYTDDTGYQVCNSFIAYHNGGLFGKGLGNSSQKYLYLPEAHTDFIFPIVVEELGLIIGILVILGYIYILYRILKIAKQCDNIQNSLICYGTFLYLLLHLLINFMGSLALIPLTGVPIPFLSYGGSYNMNVIFLLFIVLRISYENNYREEKKAIARLAK